MHFSKGIRDPEIGRAFPGSPSEGEPEPVGPKPSSSNLWGLLLPGWGLSSLWTLPVLEDPGNLEVGVRMGGMGL